MPELFEQGPVVKPGDTGKNFSLKDQNDKTFDLLENSGRNTILSFHPLAWTVFCAEQMTALEKNYEVFGSFNTTAVGISVDSVPCKKAWADSLSIRNTRLLSDFWPHGSVARLYGLFREANGFSERANIIVDKNQKIIFAKVYPIHSIPDFSEIIEFLKTVEK
ncbi:MAG TPA: redoxin domain-containing protein [Methanoregulaceae archaeon]|nr:redoxin domain-containing protein [Methanoregulaceae archaeon]